MLPGENSMRAARRPNINLYRCEACHTYVCAPCHKNYCQTNEWRDCGTDIGGGTLRATPPPWNDGEGANDRSGQNEAISAINWHSLQAGGQEYGSEAAPEVNLAWHFGNMLNKALETPALYTILGVPPSSKHGGWRYGAWQLWKCRPPTSTPLPTRSGR